MKVFTLTLEDSHGGEIDRKVVVLSASEARDEILFLAGYVPQWWHLEVRDFGAEIKRFEGEG